MRMRGGWVGWCWWGSWGLWMMMSWWWLQVCVVSALSGVIWGGLCGSFESISYATYLCLYILYSCYSYCDQPIVSLLVTSVITCTMHGSSHHSPPSFVIHSFVVPAEQLTPRRSPRVRCGCKISPLRATRRETRGGAPGFIVEFGFFILLLSIIDYAIGE